MMKIELAIGTRFYHEGNLCEVVKIEHGACEKCVMYSDECNTMACIPISRHDGKNVCFKLVEKNEEENNG